MGRCSQAFVRLAMAALGYAGPAALGQTTPSEYRLGDFAEMLYHPVGSQRLTIIGDSINTTATQGRMLAGYRDAWHIPWNGWVVHADNGASDLGYMNAQNVASPGFTFVWNPGDSFMGGQAKVNPVRTREINYARPPWPGMLMSDAMLVSSQTAKFPSGDVFSSGHVTARVLFYTDFNIMGDAMVRGMRGSTVVTPEKLYRAARPLGHIQGFDIDLGTQAGSPRVQVYDSTTTAARGKAWDYFRLTLMGVLYRGGSEDGVQGSFIAHGGWRTVDHAGTWEFTDTALREYYQQIGAPTHLILWLGQNQTIVESNELSHGVGTTFKADLTAVMARHNAVIASLGAPPPRWLLVSQYKTKYPALVHQTIARSMYELSQADATVSFLNLYELAGGEAFDNAAYTTDGVHPNSAGSLYLAMVMDAAMRR